MLRFIFIIFVVSLVPCQSFASSISIISILRELSSFDSIEDYIPHPNGVDIEWNAMESITNKDTYAGSYAYYNLMAIQEGSEPILALVPFAQQGTDLLSTLSVVAELNQMKDNPQFYSQSDIAAKQSELDKNIQSSLLNIAVATTKLAVAGKIANAIPEYEDTAKSIFQIGDYFYGVGEKSKDNEIVNYDNILSVITSDTYSTGIYKSVSEEISQNLQIVKEELVAAKHLEADKTQAIQNLIQNVEQQKKQNDSFQSELASAKDSLQEATVLYEKYKKIMDDIAEELADIQGDISLYERALSRWEKGYLDLTPQQVSNYEETLAELIEAEDRLQKSIRGKEGPMYSEKLAKENYERLVAETEKALQIGIAKVEEDEKLLREIEIETDQLRDNIYNLSQKEGELGSRSSETLAKFTIALEQLSLNPNPFGGFDFSDSPSLAPVPEPATIILFGTGVVGLIGSRIRKKKK